MTAEKIEDVKVGTTKVSTSNKMSPFVNFVNQSREKTAAIIVDYSNSIPDSFEDALSQQGLSDIESVRKNKSDTLRILNTIPAYRERARQHFNNLEQELKSLDINESIKTGAIKGFQKNKETSIADFDEYFTIQEGLLQGIFNLLTLMENAHGSYEYDEEGKVLFNEDKDVSEYNALMASILGYALQEQEWSDKGQAKELSNVKKLKEQMSE